MADLVKDVEKAKLASGKSEYLRFLKGERISQGQAVKAKCFDCCAYYEDGKVDCGFSDCPLYPWMPFGKARKNRPKREQTDAQKRVLETIKSRKRINHTTEKSLLAGLRGSPSTSEKSEE